jgi:hypothetical protein
MAVETVKPKYVRKGKMRSLQLDVDALEMLHELSPTRKAFGRFISELIRREYVRREKWQRRREQQPALAQVGTCDD